MSLLPRKVMEVMDVLPPDPMDGEVAEVLKGGVFYVFVGGQGKWRYSDECLGDFRDHGGGVVSTIKEREIYV